VGEADRCLAGGASAPGVLFLHELPGYTRHVPAILRQRLEEGVL
jgi:hypothetical protein